MKAKYINDKKVYIAEIITARGSNYKFAVLARDLKSTLTVVQAHESYGYASSLSIKPQSEHYLVDIEYDEANE